MICTHSNKNNETFSTDFGHSRFNNWMNQYKIESKQNISKALLSENIRNI